MLFLGGFVALLGVVGVVLTIAQAEEELSKD
jgi:hypothetical protein